MRQITEVISTKRSAHHAFITWFCTNARRPVAFFNNVIPSSPPRLRELERYDAGKRTQAPQTVDHVNELLSGDIDVLMNFEGKIPSSIERWNDRYLRPRLDGNLVRVVFLRDPVNTLASLAKRCRPKDFRSVFKYFYQVVALEEIVERVAQNRPAFCEKVVLMSPWLRDEHYRADVAKFFNLNAGKPPAEVTSQGGGSSFNGKTFDPAANAGALQERWRAVEDNPLFMTAFADERMVDAARTYFQMFGAHETIAPGVVDTLAAKARTDSAAGDYLRRILKPLRSARAQIQSMEFAPQPAIRELWKGVVTTRMMLRI